MTDVRETALDTGPVTATGVAAKLAAILAPVVGGELPVRLRAWDGSEAGSADGPLVVLNSADAVRRLLWRPGELGAAQAYVTGELDVPAVDGWDLDKALTYVWDVVAQRGLSGGRPSAAVIARALRSLAGLGVLGAPPKAPASQAQIKGRLHSQLRDSRSISFHYDLSNEFYSLILEPQMAYSCGYHSTPDVPVGAKAQFDKLSLVCRKLGLEPGMTLLDVGCGWGSLSLHAAEHFGATVTGITIAAEQKKFIDARIAERGLERPGHHQALRLPRRPVGTGGGQYDAVSSIEMGEHVGEGNYPTYASVLHRSVKPGGRVLVQQMSRSGRKGGKHPGGGPFIESFIAPDMHMRPVGETVAYLEAGGLEVRDVHGLREHYVLTVAGWLENFNANRDRLVEMMGEEVVRVWELYLVGGAMAFRDGRMGVDQILMVRPGRPAHVAARPRLVDLPREVVRARCRLGGVVRRRRRADDRHRDLGQARRPGRGRRRRVGHGVRRRRDRRELRRPGRERGPRRHGPVPAPLRHHRHRRDLGRAARQPHPAAQRRPRRGPALREDARRHAVAGRHRTRDPQGVRRPGHRGLDRVPADPGRGRGAGALVGLRLDRRRGLGASAWSSRPWATGSSRPTRPCPRREATGHADRAVALHPAPQLLRRRLHRLGASGWSAAWRRDPFPALITVVAPLAMTYFLVFATGARLLEQTMMQRPGYPEYAARTSMFFPLPPEKS